MRAGTGSGGRWRGSVAARAAVACAAVLLALVVVLCASRDRDAAPVGGGPSAGAEGAAAADAPSGGPGEGAGAGAWGTSGPRADDAGEGDDGLASVSERSSDLDLAEESSRIVRAYRDRGDCLLRRAGYLDLLGNVWSCTVEGPGWVDVVWVSASQEGGGSRVRVVRLGLEEWEAAYGGVE